MHDIIRSEHSADLLSEVASNAGAIMLENGAEIYRVEDTVERIIRSKDNVSDVDVYSTFNVIILSFSYKGEIHSNIRRVKSRSNNLYYIDKVNSFSRSFVNGEMSLREALKALRTIKKDKGTPLSYKVLGSGFAAGAYSILMGGGVKEMGISFLVGMAAYFVASFLEKNQIGFFIVNFFYGMVVSSLTILIASFVPGLLKDAVIISSMMAFLPGITLTNAMRDMMGGDSTSGLTGAIVGILISTALAMGVGFPISLARIWS